MGAGLLAVKSGFILFIKNYQFPLHITTLERESKMRTRSLKCLFAVNKKRREPRVKNVTLPVCYVRTQDRTEQERQEEVHAWLEPIQNEFEREMNLANKYPRNFFLLIKPFHSQTCFIRKDNQNSSLGLRGI